MFKIAALGLSLMLPAAALACPGKKADTTTAAVAPAAATNPAACAKKADLVGSNCSYSTGMMAQRVLAEGTTYTYVGTLSESENSLASHVASPFTVGAETEKAYVIANEVVEALTTDGLHDDELSIEGKVLEVDGVKYFVVTNYAARAA